MSAERFSELPEETRKFLMNLRDEDVEQIKDGLELVRAISTVGKVAKWIIVGIFGMFIGLVMLWENILKVIHLSSK